MQKFVRPVGIALLVLIAAIGVFVIFSSGYQPISKQSYAYALALLSACARQDEATVQRIAKEVREQNLPAYDRRVILAITEKALSGQWDKSSAEARNLLKAQSRSEK